MIDGRYINNLGVFTSGGDAQGMNAAVRAVIRTALSRDLDVYAIYEGYQGMIEGGDKIRKMDWDSVGSILQYGGTVLGSARSTEFRTREGRLKAAYNLVINNIDGLAVIGGDGSLTGANLFRQEWPDLLDELVDQGKISPAIADDHMGLALVGLVGSIDNDMFGTDMTIGADSALHRIVDAIDNITSTAASHQRTFVIEVMGRHCGYLTLMAGLATGANWVLIPEYPPQTDDWVKTMSKTLKAGREMGRRQSIVLVAEGAQDKFGNSITSRQVSKILAEELGEEVRVTILGHVQRGGAPSAFDRNMSSIIGYAAVNEILSMTPHSEPLLIGIRDNTVTHSPLMEMVAKTKQVAAEIAAHNFDTAIQMRGRGFVESYQTLRTLSRARPHTRKADVRQLRIAVMHSGSTAPGMNTAARVAVRLGIDAGHTMLGVINSFSGLKEGRIEKLHWMSVHNWVSRGGAELGTNRWIPETEEEFETVANNLAMAHIDGLMIIGGSTAYNSAYQMAKRRSSHPAFNIPILCLPATINNDLPGTELTIGADTALNTIVANVDRIKESAAAASRAFVVEVMGRDCGYLGLMSALATGAEQFYLPEEGISLDMLRDDVHRLTGNFEKGKRLGLLIRSENADPLYTTNFLVSLFEKEGGSLFDVRQTILGHVQRGGSPSPYDRVQATRLAARGIQHLIEDASQGEMSVVGIGRQLGKISFTNLEVYPSLMQRNAQRPRKQWWLGIRTMARVLAKAQTSRRR